MNDDYSFEQAKKILAVRDGRVHTFYNLPFGLIGADWQLKEILKEMKKASRLVKTGPKAIEHKHGLAIIPYENCKQSDILFVETIVSMPSVKTRRRKDE